jgi:perosamine synthetase
MPEPFIPVFAPWLAKSARGYILDCLETGWLSSLGPYVHRFEKDFSALCGTEHAVAVSSGTAALHLALAAANIGSGDEVIVPALTFIATANAVTYTGARPVFADVDPQTWTLDPADVEQRLTRRTRAIVAVHLYGHPVHMDSLLDIARARHLVVIEDAAEAHGARYKGRPVGGLGHVGCFSFYGNKIISTGEGGMLVTNDAGLADRAVSLRNHADDGKGRYFHTAVGFNYRMSNLQAAVGCAQLEDLRTILERKREIAREYAIRLRGISGLSLPVEAPWAWNVYWMYSVLIEDRFGRERDAVMNALRTRDIDTRPFFVPLHRLPSYASEEPRPVAEELARKGINLPSGPTLTDCDIARVCAAVADLAR